MVNVLLRADPSRTRTLSERAQADEIYHPGQSLRVRNQSLASPIIDFTDERVDSPAERTLA
jgi:E3 ubiquitin-protein ligase CHFR